ncbi:hypothetical protein JXM83_04535 [Candidatus Woesearchaeota archaeon]|nr:hypothetical protein [Candidatus Woesearchaeota archaeon]
MNVKKAVKKIAAVAFGAAMVGSTVLGAADLADYPSNMMSSGAFDGKIVIGLAAKPQDVIAAIDIATNLQAESVSASSVACSGSAATTTYSIEGGVQIKDDYSALNYEETFQSVVPKFKEEDLSGVLADGEVEDDDGTAYEYEQTIEFATGALDSKFGMISTNDIFGDDPVAYIDMSGSQVYSLVANFIDDMDVSALDDSEEIELFGKTFTFDSGITATGNIVLYTSTVTETLSVGDTKTVPVNGVDTEIEVLGGNTDAGTALIKVDGTTKEVEEGRSYSFSGKDIRIKSIFTTTIPTESVAVEVEVGSDSLVLPVAAASPFWTQVEDDDGDDFDGLYVKVTGANNTAVSKIEFGISPQDTENDAEDDNKYLLSGMEFVTPVFDTVAVSFEGVTPSLTSGDMFSVEVSGDTLTVKFTNEDGDEFAEDLLVSEAASQLTFNSDYEFAASNISEDKMFFLNEQDGDIYTTILYSVDAVKSDSDNHQKDYVELSEVGSGNSLKLYREDLETADAEIGNTGVYLAGIGIDSKTINLSSDMAGNVATTTSNVIYTKGDLKVTLGNPDEVTAAAGAGLDTSTDDFDVLIDEDTYGDIVDDSTMSAKANISIGISANADKEINVGEFPANVTNDDAGETGYYLGGLGLYAEFDVENDEWARVYTDGELQYVAFVKTDEAKVTSTSAGAEGSVASVKVNPISVGVAISDEDAMKLVGKENLIVVGGPSVNTVAAKLKGNPTREEILAEYKMGVGLVELYDSAMSADLGNTLALLVGGYEWADTQRAARAVALHDDDNFKGDAIEVHGTSTTISEIKAVEE